MTRDEIIALARECGASAYANRHYQGETYMTFSPEKLEAFFHAAQQAEHEACAELAQEKAIRSFGKGRSSAGWIEQAISNRSKS